MHDTVQDGLLVRVILGEFFCDKVTGDIYIDDFVPCCSDKNKMADFIMVNSSQNCQSPILIPCTYMYI